MSTSGDIAGSSRSEEETRFKEEDDDSNPRPGSQRFVKSLRKEEETRNIPTQYTNQQQAELLRKLDSIKGHLLRGGKPKDSDQPPMGFHGHKPSYYNPYPDPLPYGMYPSTPYRDPYGYPTHQNWYPGHYPNQMLPRPPYPQGQYVDIGPDILDPQLQDPRFFPVTPSRYSDVPYSPVSHQSHHTRGPSEVSSEMGGAFARKYVQKAVSDTDSRRCHPLAGGAPFIACHNCFELLYLPKKKLLANEKQQKLQCGACSEVISFIVLDKKIVFSSSALVETSDDCPLKDEESRISISSEPQKEVVKSVRRRVKGENVPPPPENSNLLELFEYSNVNRAAIAYGMANKQESYTKQDSMEPESVATETDVSYNGYYNNTDVSEDSRISKASKEDRKPRNRKESSEHSFSEVTNKIISNKEEQLEVWVNGHLIPEDLVVRAEKQAGPVQAGKYWYDYRAGFWGVMGNPCLGIIPPFIEEFNGPMQDTCGAGNTSVFVNGRELHEKDLELLSCRGLPRDKNRSYIVDISGRVLDGDSGEELKSLGKLAPTIEKVKHGFGMRVPRSLAS